MRHDLALTSFSFLQGLALHPQLCIPYTLGPLRKPGCLSLTIIINIIIIPSSHSINAIGPALKVNHG
jgi:hypothetical protein